jgi:6-phosphogluconolactonase
MTNAVSAASHLVYFGTYTKKTSQGLYAARFDADTGRLTPAEFVAPGANPTFLALHPRLPVLYAIGERKTEGRPSEGQIIAYDLDLVTGRLTRRGELGTGGATLCYIQVDPTGQSALVASYGGGYVAAFSLTPDGSLRERTAFEKHTGKGPHAQQDSPHAHCIDAAPGGRFAFSADLAADKIFAYRLDAASGSLTPHATGSYHGKPGAGPRHVAFHPNGRFAYAINELTSTVTALAFDADAGSLREIETVDSIPDETFSGRRWGAEVAVHPAGKFLYISNRADHESLALFTIDEKTGRLTFVAHTHEGIKHPRHFAIDPSGRWLLCANHDADTVSVFAIDPGSGRLTPAGSPIAVPSPVCVLFAR